MNDTKKRLLEAAQRLYAERGLEAVSLREINQAAGARNAIAIQYHFQDRFGVIRAILERHLPDVDARRHALLDQWEAVGEPDIRLLAAALVRPFAAKLADPGGREFLQIWAELVNRPLLPGSGGAPDSSPESSPDSLSRWRALVKPLLAEDAARLHRRFTAILHASLELARRARTGPHTDDRLFTSYLIDVVSAILAAPVSEETRRLAAERDAARAAG